MQGKVKWYNFKKGYGFIEGEDGEEYFVHYSALSPEVRRLNENDAVSFDTKETDKGMQAVNVTLGSSSKAKARKAEEEPEEEPEEEVEIEAEAAEDEPEELEEEPAAEEEPEEEPVKKKR